MSHSKKITLIVLALTVGAGVASASGPATQKTDVMRSATLGRAAVRLDKSDTNGDGSLDYGAINPARTTMKSHQDSANRDKWADRRAPLVDMVDEDGNKTITKIEFETNLSKMVEQKRPAPQRLASKDRAKKAVIRIDMSGDGQVTRDEVDTSQLKMMEKWSKKRHSGSYSPAKTLEEK